MLEYTGHGSCIWRSTGVGAEDNKIVKALQGLGMLDVSVEL